MAAPLSEFTDFVNMTPEQYITSPEDMVNDAVNQVPLLGHMLLGANPNEVLQGGSLIRDTIKLNITSTAQFYLPGASSGGYSNRQTSVLNEIRWRFQRDFMVWTDAEIELQIPEGLGADARHALYKKLKFSKEQDLWTSLFNAMDDALLANANGNTATYEAAGGTDPYPLSAFISERTNALPRGWTNVANIPPATEAQWRNLITQYDFAQPDDEDGDADGLLDAFETTWLNLQWVPPRLSGTEKFFQKSGRNPERMFIASSPAGIAFYKRRLLERNDTLNNSEDPAFQNPKYSGIATVQVSGLATAALYQNAADDEEFSELSTSVATSGHRYYWVDSNFLSPVIHVRKFFEQKPAMILEDQPDTAVRVVNVWWNLFPKSRRRQAIVSPGA